MTEMDSVLPSPETPVGERVARRLREEVVIWLTTNSADGTPQPNPVWFYWDEARQSVLIYSLAKAARLAHIDRSPRVALNLDGNGKGGDIIVLTGAARRSVEDPPADQHSAFTEKYRDLIARSFGTPEHFAARYSVALRIIPSRFRGG
jgi:PPOX class probable F420-dependent enzyme